MSSRRGVVLAALLDAPLLLLVATLGVAMPRQVGGQQLGAVESRLGRCGRFHPANVRRGDFTLSDHADGAVFLYFWDSWCLPCQQEAPLIQLPEAFCLRPGLIVHQKFIGELKEDGVRSTLDALAAPP